MLRRQIRALAGPAGFTVTGLGLRRPRCLIRTRATTCHRSERLSGLGRWALRLADRLLRRARDLAQRLPYLRLSLHWEFAERCLA